MEKLQLSLELVPGEAVVAKEELPSARVRLTNAGEEAVVVNGRMLWAPDAGRGGIRELTFLIEGPAGSFNRRIVNVDAGVARAEDFVSLLPGQYVERCYPLRDYYYYAVSGRYTIRAGYHQEASDLFSNTVRFEIK